MVKSNRDRLLAAKEKYRLSRVLMVEILRMSGFPNTSKSVVDSYLLPENSPHHRKPRREHVDAVVSWGEMYKKNISLEEWRRQWSERNASNE